MPKVVRTTPIDRSKRTAVKGGIVDAVNIIHGKRKRRLSNNTFNEDYIVNSPRTPTRNKKKDKKRKEIKKESSSSSDDESESDDGVEIIIPLSGNRNKYQIVDEEDVKEEEEEEELDGGENNLFSQELSETKKPTKKKVQQSSLKIFNLDGTELSPITKLNPQLFFSGQIVKHIERLGEFPQTYDSTKPIVYETNRIFAPDALRIFSSIKWNGMFKSSLIPEVCGLKFEVFTISEFNCFDFLVAHKDRIMLIGDAVDAILAVDAYYPMSETGLGDFWVYVIIDSKRHEPPTKVRLSTLLESLTIDETDYGSEVEVEFTQK